MAIKILNFEKSDLLEEGNINFSNSNIATIIGMNGSGKSILFAHLKNNFTKEWVEQNVSKQNFEEIEKSILEFFNVGKHREKFENFAQKIKEDGLKKLDEVKNTLNIFLWERYIDSYKNVIENNFTKIKCKEINSKLAKLKKNEWFYENKISEQIPELIEFAPTKKIEDCSIKLKKEFDKIFGKPKIISVDFQKDVFLEGPACRNNIDNITLAAFLREEHNFFVRLIRILNLGNKELEQLFLGENNMQNKYNEKINEYNERINEWFKSCISQNIKIKLEFYDDQYQITFWENENQLDFTQLSDGTKNLIIILSQIGELNSETIIQIDEPEKGMHPIMQIQFRNFLEDLTISNKVRFIIYTHSNHIVKDGQDTKGLYIMNRKNGKSKIYSKKAYVEVNDIMDIQIFEYIGFESYEKNYNFDKDKKIIIVEGETDVIYLKKMANLLNINDFNFCRAKLGGSPNIYRTAILFEQVHNFKKENIILSPDLDIETKDKKTFKDIKNDDYSYFPLGNNDRPEIEGMFSPKDQKYVVQNLKSNNNRKMNKANFFHREVKNLNQLSPKTIKNFQDYFDKIKN